MRLFCCQFCYTAHEEGLAVIVCWEGEQQFCCQSPGALGKVGVHLRIGGGTGATKRCRPVFMLSAVQPFYMSEPRVDTNFGVARAGRW
jgi:hypothetical protein